MVVDGKTKAFCTIVTYPEASERIPLLLTLKHQKESSPVPIGVQNVDCTDCPAGYSCLDPASPPVVCASGTYSTARQTSCTDCPTGQACLDPSAAPTNCDAGTYSPQVNDQGWVEGKGKVEGVQSVPKAALGRPVLGGSSREGGI